MPLTNELLPEPLTPVTTVITFSGKVTSMFLRLLRRAPLTVMALFQGRRKGGVSICSSPVK